MCLKKSKEIFVLERMICAVRKIFHGTLVCFAFLYSTALIIKCTEILLKSQDLVVLNSFLRN